MRPEAKYRDTFLAGMSEFSSMDQDMIWERRLASGDFEGYLRVVDAWTRGEEIPPGWVAVSTFWLIDDDAEYVGSTNVRHILNDYLRDYGGHIGYTIRPTRRRQGHGTEICRLALIEAKAARPGPRPHHLRRRQRRLPPDHRAQRRGPRERRPPARPQRSEAPVLVRRLIRDEPADCACTVLVRGMGTVGIGRNHGRLGRRLVGACSRLRRVRAGRRASSRARRGGAEAVTYIRAGDVRTGHEGHWTSSSSRRTTRSS